VFVKDFLDLFALCQGLAPFFLLVLVLSFLILIEEMSGYRLGLAKDFVNTSQNLFLFYYD